MTKLLTNADILDLMYQQQLLQRRLRGFRQGDPYSEPALGLFLTIWQVLGPRYTSGEVREVYNQVKDLLPIRLCYIFIYSALSSDKLINSFSTMGSVLSYLGTNIMDLKYFLAPLNEFSDPLRYMILARTRPGYKKHDLPLAALMGESRCLYELVNKASDSPLPPFEVLYAGLCSGSIPNESLFTDEGRRTRSFELIKKLSSHGENIEHSLIQSEITRAKCENFFNGLLFRYILVFLLSACTFVCTALFTALLADDTRSSDLIARVALPLLALAFGAGAYSLLFGYCHSANYVSCANGRSSIWYPLLPVGVSLSEAMQKKRLKTDCESDAALCEVVIGPVDTLSGLRDGLLRAGNHTVVTGWFARRRWC